VLATERLHTYVASQHSFPTNMHDALVTAMQQMDVEALVRRWALAFKASAKCTLECTAGRMTHRWYAVDFV
jgi:hypothetical protein